MDERTTKMDANQVVPLGERKRLRQLLGCRNIIAVTTTGSAERRERRRSAGISSHRELDEAVHLGNGDHALRRKHARLCGEKRLLRRGIRSALCHGGGTELPILHGL